MGVQAAAMFAALASCCAALWLVVRRSGPSAIGRVEAACRLADDGLGPSDALVLQMLAVALRKGASIPCALDAVGDVAGGLSGDALCRVSQALYRGVLWDDAWRVGDDVGLPVCRLIGEGLRDSWEHGSSPVRGLELAVQCADRDARHAIEQGAAALSVRILLPMALCFLPAFVMIGVVPTAMSLIGG
ncbi:type II secretion system F family protein [Bifidobacterium apri]|uniref:type II secretion system F family protein n=1 Tax=Bifidobacterium apri TaxID=1769423 RepID=UPI003990EF7C